ncbi:hypothetical protein [Pantoea agglomerans]|uniref:hypothetical protein n=1 Tax=Enterobacter agglomerans TaxID=549 RepID=UPI0013CAABC7|nr:hypothetical protein [Pantoea agglomerans]NEG59755.1 hypothetical protein [Pantoea agglomerans]NEH05293.1 hypothetical protein [Pantoea agglomerans]NEH16331.1 hypothetical protein [Pantoea agglomerans]
MKTSFSDKSQRGILEYLFRIYPRTMSESEICREFGLVNNKGLVANIRQLISEGNVEQRAIVKTMGRDTVSPDGLKLTRNGCRPSVSGVQVPDHPTEHGVMNNLTGC